MPPPATPGAGLPQPRGRGGPRPPPSGRGNAPRKVARPGRLSAALPDHALDLEGDGERPKILRLGKLDLAGNLRGAHGADQVADLELEGVVLVDEEVLDERGLAVPDRLAIERVFLRGAAVDLDVLVGV